MLNLLSERYLQHFGAEVSYLYLQHFGLTFLLLFLFFIYIGSGLSYITLLPSFCYVLLTVCANIVAACCQETTKAKARKNNKKPRSQETQSKKTSKTNKQKMQRATKVTKVRLENKKNFPTKMRPASLGLRAGDLNGDKNALITVESRSGARTWTSSGGSCSVVAPLRLT